MAPGEAGAADPAAAALAAEWEGLAAVVELAVIGHFTLTKFLVRFMSSLVLPELAERLEVTEMV
jgi:hypothetical protein